MNQTSDQLGTMSDAHSRKWTALLMSLIAPGAGQLWIGSWWCMPWMAAGIALVGAIGVLESQPFFVPAILVGGLVLTCLLSAEHARRLAEPPAPWPSTAGNTAEVRYLPPRGLNVRMAIELQVARPAAEVWRRVADLPRFLCIDPFHARIQPLGPKLEPGTDLLLEHQAFGISLPRFGRLLSWREGCGYAFSDLSARGPRHGFPHVFFVQVEPSGRQPETSRVSIHVRGKWTSPVPLCLGQLWLRWVARDHARLLKNGL